MNQPYRASFLVIFLFLLSSCSSTAQHETLVPETPTILIPTSTYTTIPISTYTQTPTLSLFDIPSQTPTSIPSLINLSISVPDPKFTNPELFWIKKNLIPGGKLYYPPAAEFANAMNMIGIEVSPEQVIQKLTYKEMRDVNGNPAVVGLIKLDPDPKNDGENLEIPIPIIIAEKDETGAWSWEQVSLKNLGGKIGINFGSHLGDTEAIEELSTGLVTFDWARRQKEPNTPIDFNWFHTQARFANDNRINEIIFNHLYYPDHAPKWLNTLQSKEEITSYFYNQFKILMNESLQHDITYFNVYNEPKLVGDNGKVYRPDYIYDKLYGTMTSEEKFQEPYLPVVWLFEEADKVRKELKNQYPDKEIKLGFSNSTTHFPDGACLSQSRQIINSLAKRNLIDYYNIHGGVKNLNEVLNYSDGQIEELFNSFKVTRSDGRAVDLVIGEFILDLNDLKTYPEEHQYRKQMEAANKFMNNSLNAGISKFVFFGMKDEVITWGYKSHPIDKSGRKKPFYYGVTSALLKYWTLQQQ